MIPLLLGLITMGAGIAYESPALLFSGAAVLFVAGLIHEMRKEGKR